jgi:hypothetical protein
MIIVFKRLRRLSRGHISGRLHNSTDNRPGTNVCLEEILIEQIKLVSNFWTVCWVVGEIVRMSIFMIDTQQVWETLWYESHKNKNKVVIG